MPDAMATMDTAELSGDRPTEYPGERPTEYPGERPGALDVLDDVLALVRRVVGEVDPDRVTGHQAALLLERLVKIDRAVAAGRLGFARRAAQCMTWREEGHRSAASWLAQKTKTSIGEAITTLETAACLPTLPATRAALCDGSLSLPQVREITAAASADPAAEAELIDVAGHLSLKALQHRARSVRAVAGRDDAARYAAIRRERFLRHWLDPEGAFHIHTRLTPDAGAELLAAVKSLATFVADEVRQANLEPEPRQAYEADALVALATGDCRRATFEGTVGGRVRSATMYFHVSLEALRRGHLQHGEVCEIAGVGPVPLATVENLVGESAVKLIVRDGVDVTTVCHLGRSVPAHVESALEARDRSCVVPGCDVDLGLEIDHWKVPYAQGGPTALWNLARLCRFHHQQKTYDGYRLTGGPGDWRWSGPKGPAVEEDDVGAGGGWP
ncbi:MAG TPA: DUF222 domain-containing protein [Acidimicrobiales bacterium]|nr:DUF222 domain-containing protein [Acidimicrobiales bacterium]